MRMTSAGHARASTLPTGGSVYERMGLARCAHPAIRAGAMPLTPQQRCFHGGWTVRNLGRPFKGASGGVAGQVGRIFHAQP